MERRYGQVMKSGEFKTEVEHKTLHAMAQAPSGDVRRPAPMVTAAPNFKFPPIPSGPWANAGPVPDEPFIDGSDCGDTVGVALGGAGK
jgi:hypothetical protein